MEQQNCTACAALTGKLYGGLSMRWRNVILFAVGAAALTALFLTVPIFKDTSFRRVGETLEAWIFCAVLIMSNCRRPLESALKVFVFFLVSQPLIYLFQVPFSWQGWGLFGYYRYWFFWTLLTFPTAFVGWYITRRNWLSVLIFAPVLCFLAYSGFISLSTFPKFFLLGIFCFAQVLLYVFEFFPKVPQRIVGLLLPALAVAVFVLLTPQVNLTVVEALPDTPALSAQASVSLEDDSLAEVRLTVPKECMLRIDVHQYGRTGLYVTDGEEIYRYTLEVYDDNGVARVVITPEHERESVQSP